MSVKLYRVLLNLKERIRVNVSVHPSDFRQNILVLASPIQLRLQFVHLNFVISFMADVAALWLSLSSLSLNMPDKSSTGSFNF